MRNQSMTTAADPPEMIELFVVRNTVDDQVILATSRREDAEEMTVRFLSRTTQLEGERITIDPVLEQHFVVLGAVKMIFWTAETIRRKRLEGFERN